MSFDLLAGHDRDLGGFSVRRVLPAAKHRAVGPFVFFDHLGPAVLAAGAGVQVRPHPHIGLATVTYLLDGEMVHRDSLGNVQTIRPGDVNWMSAGRGIVHSERAPDALLGKEQPMHAVQSWVALPMPRENDDPSFAHHPSATLPTFTAAGVCGTVIAGTAYGLRSPVDVPMPTLYAVVTMEAGSTIVIDAEHEQRAVFVIGGSVSIEGVSVPPGSMAVLTTQADVAMTAHAASTLMLLGGARLDAPRALEWNFVASERNAIEQARVDWQSYPNARFPQVPGETESIPLPPRPRHEPTVL